MGPFVPVCTRFTRASDPPAVLFAALIFGAISNFHLTMLIPDGNGKPPAPKYSPKVCSVFVREVESHPRDWIQRRSENWGIS